MRSSFLCLFPLFALAGSPLVSQAQFSELRSGLLPFQSGGGSGAVVVGDVDRDGDLDLVLAGSRLVLYLNDGSGAFTEAPGRLPPKSGALVMGDVDGDGDLDLVVGRWGSPNGAQNILLLNDGRGNFLDKTIFHLPQIIDATTDVALADVDGDGDLDLIVANSAAHFDPPRPQRNRLQLNDGKGRFRDVTSTNMPGIAFLSGTLIVEDLDSDGDLDLVFGNSTTFLGPSGQDRLYLNNGRGFFTDGTGGRIPARNAGTYDIHAIDIDGDGDKDLMIAAPKQDRLLLNNGKAKFTDVTAARLPKDIGTTSCIESYDVDRDGDLDLVLAKYKDYQTGLSNRLLLNNGRGSFSDATKARLPAAENITVLALMFDVDGDKHADLFFGNPRDSDCLLLNDGKGRFVELTTVAMPVRLEQTFTVALGDVDGDGDLDLAVGNIDYVSYPTKGQPNRLLLNDGNGKFSDSTAGLPARNNDGTRALVLVDLDGDGDLDQFHANWGQNRLWSNQGNGTFVDASATALPFDGDSTSAVAAGDVDGDGDLDLLLGNGFMPWSVGRYAGQQNRLYLNRSGVFMDVTPIALPVGKDTTSGVALGDVDGDGDLDLVCANMATQNRLYLNDGSGVFTDATSGKMPVDAEYSRAVVLGDVDGDGDLDLLFGNGTNGFMQQDRLYLNDGRGKFTDVTSARLPRIVDDSRSLVLIDVDLDGDLDVVRGASHTGTQACVLYRNNGRGVFVAVKTTSLHDDSRRTNSVAIGDVDGDGDPDIVTGNERSSNRVLFNLHRQLHAPRPARLGRRFELAFHAKPGYARIPQVALPFVNTTNLQPRLALPPLGRLGVNPNGLLMLASVTVPAPAGTTTKRYVIPKLPGLLGVTIYSQALILHTPQMADWRFTRVVASPIRL